MKFVKCTRLLGNTRCDFILVSLTKTDNYIESPSISVLTLNMLKYGMNDILNLVEMVF